MGFAENKTGLRDLVFSVDLQMLAHINNCAGKFVRKKGWRMDTRRGSSDGGGARLVVANKSVDTRFDRMRWE